MIIRELLLRAHAKAEHSFGRGESAVGLGMGDGIRCKPNERKEFADVMSFEHKYRHPLSVVKVVANNFLEETNAPLSLSFISFSRLLQSQQYGEVHFQLLADEWPDEIRDKVVTMLRSAPLLDFLKLSSYAPAHAQQIIPMAAIKQSNLLAQAA
jgi:hypothetical protein